MRSTLKVSCPEPVSDSVLVARQGGDAGPPSSSCVPPTGKVLIIGGSIANFTNVAATFKVNEVHRDTGPDRRNAAQIETFAFLSFCVAASSLRASSGPSGTTRVLSRKTRLPSLFDGVAPTIRRGSGSWGKWVSFIDLIWMVYNYTCV